MSDNGNLFCVLGVPQSLHSSRLRAFAVSVCVSVLLLNCARVVSAQSTICSIGLVSAVVPDVRNSISTPALLF
jgi:hypothetical protein